MTTRPTRQNPEVKVGDRVSLVKSEDEWAPEPGTQGTVRSIDDEGTVFVNWDDGEMLGMVADAGDRFDVVV